MTPLDQGVKTRGSGDSGDSGENNRVNKDGFHFETDSNCSVFSFLQSHNFKASLTVSTRITASNFCCRIFRLKSERTALCILLSK